MSSEDLKKRVLRYIDRKQEGDSWDFKRQWDDQERGKSDLLHDVICMSNLLGNEDGIIIIGVDEENDYSICDISNDPNRKNTHEMVKFLLDKPFRFETVGTALFVSLSSVLRKKRKGDGSYSVFSQKHGIGTISFSLFFLFRLVACAMIK